MLTAAVWNEFQSVDERHPAFEPSATVQPIAKPEPMIDCPAVAVIPPVDVTVPVATVPSVDGVPMPVQYESCPMIGVVDVETRPLASAVEEYPPRVPDQLPEVFKLNDVPSYVSPVPAVVVAPEYTVPRELTARLPGVEESAGICRVPEMVEEPVAKNELAPMKPIAVVVET